jgi:predicted dehydrogenase
VKPSYAEVLADPEIEAVVLATPHSQHLEQIEEAAAAGKHIFVEKPITLTAADARKAFAAAEAAGVVLAVGFNRRFHPSMQRLLSLAREGTLGKIVQLEGNMSAPGLWIYKPGNWRQQRAEQPAGGMTGMGIHIIDAMIAAAGPIASVRAEARRLVNPDGLDEVTGVLLEMRSGALAYVGTSIATNVYFNFRVFGTEGWAEVRNADLSEVVVGMRGQQSEVVASHGFDMMKTELEAFADAVAGRAPFPVPKEDVIHGIEVMEAVFRSADVNADVAIAA